MGNVIEGLEDHVTEKTTVTGSAQNGNLSFAASGMKGWRNTMEDCHTLCTSIPVPAEGNDDPQQSGSLQDHSLFAVYDGHGGDFTSRYAGERFVELFSASAEWKKYTTLPADEKKGRRDVTGVDLLRVALKVTFLDLDEELRGLQVERNAAIIRNRDSLEETEKENRPRLERSGSTICVVIVTPSHIVCANAGDSRAILRRGARVLPLSFDHKPSNVQEMERIVSCGGYVKGKRVDGDLAVSRGLGDFQFKNKSDFPAYRQKVIAEPDVIVYPREEKDEFLVLACDGVWDVASNKQCANMIQEVLEEGETDMGLICEEVLDTCLERNSRDNMTMIMVGLPGMKLCKSSLTKRNAVWSRRTARQAKLVKLQAQMAAQSAAAGVGIDLGMENAPVSAQKTKLASQGRKSRVRQQTVAVN